MTMTTTRDTIQLAEAVQQHFPSMPWKRCLAIARHAHSSDKPVNGHSKHSQSMSEYLTRLVAANIRHTLTGYDNLFALGYDKPKAREAVQPAVTRQLAAWR